MSVLEGYKRDLPAQLADNDTAAKISMDPAFTLWVPHTLKKRNRIISKVKFKYLLKTHKFKINFSNNMKQEITFDHENGNKLWWYAVCQDMKNVRPSFETWEKPESGIPPGYQEIKCHLISDIKMGYKFCRKACFVVGGHRFCSLKGFGTHFVNYCRC